MFFLAILGENNLLLVAQQFSALACSWSDYDGNKKTFQRAENRSPRISIDLAL